MKRFPWLILLLVMLLGSIPDKRVQAQNAPPNIPVMIIPKGSDYILRVRTHTSANRMEIRVQTVKGILSTTGTLTFPVPPAPDSTTSTMVWARAPFYVGDNGDTKTTIKHFKLTLGQLAPGYYKLYIGNVWFNDKDADRVDFEIFRANATGNPGEADAPVFMVSNEPDRGGTDNPGSSGDYFIKGLVIPQWHFLPGFVFIVQ